jgi:hypothetical protein
MPNVDVSDGGGDRAHDSVNGFPPPSFAPRKSYAFELSMAVLDKKKEDLRDENLLCVLQKTSVRADFTTRSSPSSRTLANNIQSGNPNSDKSHTHMVILKNDDSAAWSFRFKRQEFVGVSVSKR